jgi:Fe-S-cluster-containing hydrogenase component 2
MGQQETFANAAPLWMEASELDHLILLLKGEGFTVVGPRLDQGAIVYGEIERASDLPRGWSDDQEPGKYRLEQTGGEAFFEYNVGPQSWKQFFFPPRLTVEQARRQADGGWTFSRPDPSDERFALLGVRACELAAIGVQDRVMMHGPFVDTEYAARRESALIIAVNCTVAAETCFCTSMGSGPRCQAGFDLALTETEDGFVVEVGSDAGRNLTEQLEHCEASSDQLDSADRLRRRAEDQISKAMNTEGIRDLLLNNLNHPQWDKVAARCLSCTNCTMVCPTCFCSTVNDVSELAGDKIERVRQWDSCFNLEFGYTAGGTVRNSIRNRYRQWLTHKLASWHDQFDTSGCVGCGRCITWCPVGIDLTEEVDAIRQQPAKRRELPLPQRQPDACVVRADVAAIGSDQRRSLSEPGQSRGDSPIGDRGLGDEGESGRE